MKPIPKPCKNCLYFSKIYGNKNQAGKRTESGLWCSAKNGRITNKIKHCDKREENKNGNC